jgi:hypothetical protein
MMMIAPYWSGGTWVFDDPSRGLTREPFVSGVPQMIDALIQAAGMNLTDARARGFRLLFSAGPFPGYQRAYTRTRGEYSGTWYQSDAEGGPAAEGWLCPALFKYFPEAPQKLYARAEPLE